MRTKTITVYSYSELSNKAKQKAIDWFLNVNDFQFEWDCIKDDAKTVGIELTAWDYRRNIEGSLKESFAVVLDSIMREHGDKTETYKTAKEYFDKHELLWKEYRDNEANGKDELNDDIDDRIEVLKDEFEKAILDDYRVMADKQYEYVQSDEYVSEMMEANGYEFTINGKIA